MRRLNATTASSAGNGTSIAAGVNDTGMNDTIAEVVCRNVTGYVCEEIENCLNWTCTDGTNWTSVEPEVEPTTSDSAILVNTIQAVLFNVMGPCICLAGPIIGRVVIFMQSVFATNYMFVVASFNSVNVLTIFSLIEKIVFLVTGTLTLTFATIKGKTVKNAARGGVMGLMVSTPVVAFLEVQLFQNWVKCKGVGAPTTQFPNGEPVDCESTAHLVVPNVGEFGIEYIAAIQICKFLQMLIIGVFAKVGKMLEQQAAAIMGASMFIGSFLDFAFTVGAKSFPTYAPMLMAPIMSVKPFLIYGAAGIGFVVQKAILDIEEEEVDGEKTGVKKYSLKKEEDIHFCKCIVKGPFGKLLFLIGLMDKFLEKKMEGDPNKVAPGEGGGEEEEEEKKGVVATVKEKADDLKEKLKELPALVKQKLPPLPGRS